MIDEQQTQWVVLAGGKGSRLGADKSRILIDGRPILEHLADRMAWQGPTLLVKANSQTKLLGKHRFASAVVDRFPGEGPLGGIVTALSTTAANSCVFLPIDMPLISRRELLQLLTTADQSGIACFERSDHTGQFVLEPFPLFVSASMSSRVAEHFDRGARSLRSLFNLPTSKVVRCPDDWSSSLWMNINTPGDLAAIRGTLSD